MQIIDGVTLTVEQAILLLIDIEHKGAERQLESFKKNNKFTGTNQYKALEKGLYRVAESIEKNGRGQDVTYTLNNIYKNFLHQKDGRVNNSYKHTDEELLLDEYIFNYLLEYPHKKALPYKSWAYRMGFFNTKLLKDKETMSRIENAIDSIHKDTLLYSLADRKEIISIFKMMIKDRGIKVVEKSFERLEKAKRITVHEEYFARTLENEYIKISHKEYLRFTNEENVILEEMNIERNDYIYKKINYNYRDKEFLEATKKINQHMASKYNIRYYFSGKLPIVIDRKKQIDNVNGRRVFYERLFILTESNQKSYSTENSISKRWYLLNTYTILKEFGIDIPENRYTKELSQLMHYCKNSFSIESVIDNLPIDF